jgi:hypothetical protein
VGDYLMKLSIIFIGTNQYLNFLPEWYNSCEKYLLPNIEKQYYVFTDGELSDIPSNINVYYQEHLSWPYITLLRFETILKAREELSQSDWVLFLDADMLVVDEVKEEDIFTDKKYIGVHHPCHYLGMPPHNKFPGAFETNLKSLACISDSDDTSVYFQGCLWGGKTPYVIEMIEELKNRIEIDLSNDVIAVWHDESQMNKFFSERLNDIHILNPSFAYPEDYDMYCNFEKKIVHISKNNQNYHK